MHIMPIVYSVLDLLQTFLTALQPRRSMLNLLEEISITVMCNDYPRVYGDLRCKYRLVLMPELALDQPWPEMKAI